MLVARHSNHEYVQRKHLKIGEKIDFDYPCSSQTFCSPYSISLSPGYSFLETYGASGQDILWSNNKGYGGKGGYSSGVYQILSKKDKIYLYIGGHSTGNIEKSYNGGGCGNNTNDGAGGGATDFRTKFGDWNDEQSLKSRIIVAGGGGGAYAIESNPYFFSVNGGSGGGETGERGTCVSSSQPPYGAQTGCIGGAGTYNNGTFGEGASNLYGSGGGGYWGGGNGPSCGGSGGSGYIGKVFTLGKYTKSLTSSINTGSGKASITLISLGCFSHFDHITFSFRPSLIFLLFLYK